MAARVVSEKLSVRDLEKLAAGERLKKAGGGGNRLDTRAADAVFLEHPGGRLEQFFARVVPGWSGSHP